MRTLLSIILKKRLVTTVAVPTNVSVAATSSTSLTVSWTSNSGSAHAFDIYKSTDGGGTYSACGTAIASATSFLAEGLTEGTQYYFKIMVKTGGFSSAASNTTLPATPTGLVATQVSATEVGLTWVDNSHAETGFEIFKSDSNGNEGTYALMQTTAANVTAYNKTGLTIGINYGFKVRAKQGAAYSSYSNVQIIQLVPAAPAGLALTKVPPTEIDLSWTNDVAVMNYEIWRSGDGGSNYSYIGDGDFESPTYVDTGLTSETDYYYKIRGLLQDGVTYTAFCVPQHSTPN